MISLVRSELYKMRTTPGPWVLVGIGMVMTGLFLLIPFHQAGMLAQGGGYAAPETARQLRDMLGSGLEGALILAPIAGVLCVSGEYRHKVLTTTLLVAPSRPAVLVAKSVASMLWGLVLAVTSFVMIGAVGLTWFAADGGSFSALARQVGPVVPGMLGGYVLLSLFGVGIGILVKNQIAGVLSTVGGTIIVENIIVALFQSVFHLNLNWLPSEATVALAGDIYRGQAATGHQLLSWWAGGLVLLAWGVGPAVLGYYTTFRRDVT